MNCPTCATPAPEGARFCVSCGAELALATTTIAADATGKLPAVSSPPVEPARPEELERPAPSVTVTATSDATSTSALVACPACAAPNSAGRVLCARCGVDLATGTPAATSVITDLHLPGPSVDVVGDVDVSDTPRSGRAALIVTTIVVVGALVGVGVGVGVVRSSQSGDAPLAVFDPAVYPGDAEPLVITGAGASSIRPASGALTYSPDNLVDDDLTTAWSHDPAAEAATDVDIAFALDEASWVTAIVLANGAQSGDLDFAADGRVLRLALIVNGEPVAELQLLDEPGFQQVTLPEPVLLTEVRLSVLEAVTGDTYDEISLSEIRFIGHYAIGEDRGRAAEG